MSTLILIFLKVKLLMKYKFFFFSIMQTVRREANRKQREVDTSAKHGVAT